MALYHIVNYAPKRKLLFAWLIKQVTYFMYYDILIFYTHKYINLTTSFLLYTCEIIWQHILVMLIWLKPVSGLLFRLHKPFFHNQNDAILPGDIWIFYLKFLKISKCTQNLCPDRKQVSENICVKRMKTIQISYGASPRVNSRNAEYDTIF